MLTLRPGHWCWSASAALHVGALAVGAAVWPTGTPPTAADGTPAARVPAVRVPDVLVPDVLVVDWRPARLLAPARPDPAAHPARTLWPVGTTAPAAVHVPTVLAAARRDATSSATATPLLPPLLPPLVTPLVTAAPLSASAVPQGGGPVPPAASPPTANGLAVAATAVASAAAALPPAAPAPAVPAEPAAAPQTSRPGTTVHGHSGAPAGVASAAASTGDQNVAYAFAPVPAYPGRARRLGEEGVTVVRVHVGATGLPLDLQLQGSSTWAELDEAALQALKDWRFVPALHHGSAVEAWIDVPVRFVLARAVVELAQRP